MLTILALGIGGSTAFFSVTESVLLRPLPFRDSDRLAVLFAEVAPGDFGDIRSQSTAFEEAALFNPRSFMLASPTGMAEPVPAMGVSPDFFHTLGAKPTIGRDFSPEDYRPGQDDVVILSYALWAKTFGSDPAILGRSINLNTKPHRVIGVFPDSFHFQLTRYDPPVSVWLPLAFSPSQMEERGTPKSYGTLLLVRLKRGVDLAAARADLAGVIAKLSAVHPASRVLEGQPLYSLKYLWTVDASGLLWPLLGGSGLLLLISCANAAALNLVRVLGRRSEFSVRQVLGARRSDLIGELAMEGFVLSFLAGCLGLLLALWAVSLFKAFSPSNLIPRIDEIHVDLMVLAFAFMMAVLSTAFFGLVPALTVSRQNLNSALRPCPEMGSRAVSGVLGLKTRSALLIGQVALAAALLVAAGLMARGVWQIVNADLGLDPSHVLQATVVNPASWSTHSRADLQRSLTLCEMLAGRLRSVPGVESVALGSVIYGSRSEAPFGISSMGELHPESLPTADVEAAGPEFFATLRIALVQGRFFSTGDTPAAAPVIIVNQSLARAYFGANSPIGRFLVYFQGEQANQCTIVGVVADTKSPGPAAPNSFQIYRPISQMPLVGAIFYLRTRSHLDLATAAASLKSAAVGSGLLVRELSTMDDAIFKASIARPRFLACLLATFAGLALVLTICGIYGAVSYRVTENLRGVGIRMALGAPSKRILEPFLLGAILPAVIGATVGTAASIVFVRVIRSWLYGVSAMSPVILGGVWLTLCLSAAIASYAAARRALRTDPAVLLRLG